MSSMRERLTRVIDEYAQRIRQIRALHAEVRAADEVRANERLAFDPSPEADKERRYIQSHDRLLNQTTTTLLKVCKATNDGTLGETDSEFAWGNLAAISPALAERARLAQRRRRRAPRTPRWARHRRIYDFGLVWGSPRPPRTSRFILARRASEGSAKSRPRKEPTKCQKPSHKKCRKHLLDIWVLAREPPCETNPAHTSTSLSAGTPPHPLQNPRRRPVEEVRPRASQPTPRPPRLRQGQRTRDE